MKPISTISKTIKSFIQKNNNNEGVATQCTKNKYDKANNKGSGATNKKNHKRRTNQMSMWIRSNIGWCALVLQVGQGWLVCLVRWCDSQIKFYIVFDIWKSRTMSIYYNGRRMVQPKVPKINQKEVWENLYIGIELKSKNWLMLHACVEVKE